MGLWDKGFLLTLVDRKSRYTIIRKLNSKEATPTRSAIVRCIKKHSNQFHSLTLDNGTEFADFKKVEAKTGIEVYFAHPYSSYERGTNENTNGLIRQYLPKKTDFRSVTPKAASLIEELLNHRPRRVLDYLTPYEVFFCESLIPKALNS